MTICNMSIEWGARAGMIAPDETTFAYLEGREHAPAGRGLGARGRRLALAPDRPRRDVRHARRRRRRGARAAGHLGHEPGHGRPRHRDRSPTRRRSTTRTTGSPRSARSSTWTSAPASAIEDIRIDRVFIGSCTNSRIEDLRAAAAIVAGHTVDPRVKALVVPGSAQVRRQAEEEGLDRVFLDAGFEWRLAGCSMCLGMNPDILAPGERCASTSNRNFEGRQGRGGRTHLVSPQMAAAAALHGRFVDVRTLDRRSAVPA